MTELSQLKRRVKQLERCLNDLRRLTTECEEYYERQVPHLKKESGEYAMARAITNRINRTLT